MLRRMPWWISLLIGIILAYLCWSYPFGMHSSDPNDYTKALTSVTRPLGYVALFLFGIYAVLLFLIQWRKRRNIR